MPDDKPDINFDDIDVAQTMRGHQKDDRVFDRFVLKKLLGRGGMGVVWLALDERLGRDVALKFAPQVIRFDEIAVEELKEETRKGLDLAHPNIVKTYDFLLDEDYAAISMEYIEGENLGALRIRQPGKIFETRQLTTWVTQLLDALDYAHRGAKVIHRDLKPANLMLDRFGNLRVTDFGIARSISEAMDRATLGRASAGTLAYMSPQQARGKSPSVSDDIYSFGSTVYELLTGKPPFYSGNIAQQLSDTPATPLTERRKEFNLKADPIPAAWEQTILACLEKEVELRVPSALAVMARLGLSAPSGGLPRVHSDTPLTSTPGKASTYLRPGTGFSDNPPLEGTTMGLSLVGIPSSSGPLPASSPATARTTSTLPPPLPLPPHAAPPHALPPRPPRRKGHSGWWIVLVILLMALVALAVGGWWGWDHLGLREQFYRITKLNPVTPTPLPPEPKPEPKPEPPPEPPHVVVNPEPKVPVIPDKPVGTDKPSLPFVPPPVPEPKPEPVPVPVIPKPTTLEGMLALAKPGDVITVPSGTYEETLHLKDGVSLVAAESGKVFVQTDGKNGPALRSVNGRDARITGFVFQRSGDAAGAGDRWPVAFIKASNIALQDCVFQGSVGDGVQITGAGSPTLTRCHFELNSGAGVVIERGATPTLDQCQAIKNGGSGIAVRIGGTAPKLIASACVDNAASGIEVKDGASASITGNTLCRLNKDAGITATGASATVTILSATCVDNTDGISILGGAFANIKDVIVRGSKEIGILFKLPAPGSELNDTIVDSSATQGIYVFGDAASGATLGNNHSLNNGATGIALYGSGFRPVVENNTSSNNGHYGIYVTEGCSGEVSHNTCRGNIKGAIMLDNVASDFKSEANITR